MNQHSQSGFLGSRALLILLLCAAACSILAGTLLAFLRPDVPAKVSHRTLTFAERVAYQRAIEDVYWRHRIWPKERPDPKPSLDAVMPHAQLEKKVAACLRNSQALQDYWQRPITAEQLQSEMDRMARYTKQPEVLRELFEALGNDPFVIAECLARPALAERLVKDAYGREQRVHSEPRQLGLMAWIKEPFEFWRATARTQTTKSLRVSGSSYSLPTDFGASTGGRYNPDTDSWLPTNGAPTARSGHTAVWTGSEMIVWGGYNGTSYANTGSRYSPATDSWTMTSVMNAPTARAGHTAVWTGSEMIIWGGSNDSSRFNTGGRYNPSTDSWTATTMANAPSARDQQTVVWTGTEMIVWGGTGCPFQCLLNTGGRYNPSSDTWTATSTINAPDARYSHTAVWTGSEMIVWGGVDESYNYSNTGGRYNPSTDNWTATSTTNAPSSRAYHTAIWTGSEMIVWGGLPGWYNTGGRYNPLTDSWTATTTTNAPIGRTGHTAAWTGSEMIIWGGTVTSFPYSSNTGGRYNPSTDSWTATSTTNPPSARVAHTAVWSGNEMIIWGGYFFDIYQGTYTYFDTGGKYDPNADTWAPTGGYGRAYHTAVWTGSEMIIWGGTDDSTGGRYNPTTDSWTATSTTNAPTARYDHTAIWTGTEMIIWGGTHTTGGRENTGGRYNPSTDTWTTTSTTNAPSARYLHTAVWTGSEMIVWGGWDTIWTNTGGRYDPSTDSWTATSTTNAPGGRTFHTAVWSGSEMIVWGGYNGGIVNTGGRYDSGTNSWTATSTVNVPDARYAHTAVWSGGEMIVWGGVTICPPCYSYTGGRYNPATNSWTATSITSAPSSRNLHTAVWTGNEMIVWGGVGDSGDLNTGGRYNPGTDSWMATTTTNAPSARALHTAVWTGVEMIVWGGLTPGPTPTIRPTPAPRVRPTPAPRP